MRKLSKESSIINGHISAEKKKYDCCVSTHCHDFFEFEYMVSGSGTYCIDGTEYEITEKMLYFMTPVNFHSVDMKNTVFYNVMFSADMCDIGILSRLFSISPTVIRADDNTHAFLCALIDELCKNYDNSEYASLILETLILKIASLVSVKHDKCISSDIRVAELYILENFKKGITLSDAAKHAMLSESHFSRKFMRETGKSFKEYLNSVCFEYAKKLLKYSNLTVMQICVECGFRDYPNFIRRFRQHTGMCPTDYRKSIMQLF